MWPEYLFFQMKFWLLFPFLWLAISYKITLETQANTEDPSWLPFICFQPYSKLHLLPILLSSPPAFLKFSVGNYPSSHCCCCCSITKLCLALCDPMDCSTPGYPVHHQLLELTQTDVHKSQWYHPIISSSVAPFSSCPQSCPASGSFPIYQLFASGGQSIGASTSESVLPVNIQDWSPLGWTGWISLQSKGLSRVFSSTIVRKHQFFGTQPSLWSNSYVHMWLLEKP